MSPDASMLTGAGQRSNCNFQGSLTQIGAIALSFVRKGDRAKRSHLDTIGKEV